MDAGETALVTDRISTTMVGLEPDSALALRSAFETMFAQADEWIARAGAIRVTSADQKREMNFARESRLALREIRVNAEKARKRLKEDGVRRGKAIDGIANVLKALIEPIEAHLLEQETFAFRADAARKSALRGAREEALRALGTDPTPYANLGETSEETWASVLTTAQEARAARLEAERHAAAVQREAERLAAEKREVERQAAARAEAERVARERAHVKENARLRAEAKEREQAAAEERARVEAAGTAERNRIEAEAKAAAAAARIEREKAEAAARKAREDADRAVAELAAERARKESELRAIAEAAAAVEAARAAAELAPDREKLIAFAATLRALTLPPLSTRAGKAAGVKVAVQILNLADWVAKTGDSL